MAEQHPVGEIPPEPKKSPAHGTDGAQVLSQAGATTGSTSANPLTPEEQMALFEKELKETDWGHQPC